MKASEVRSAPSIIATVSPEEFSDTWELRPKTPVAFGMRAISATDESAARLDASRIMAERCGDSLDEELLTEEYNAAFVAAVLGNAICDPNDTTRWPKELPFPQETIRDALIGPALERLFNEYSARIAALSPATPLATNDEIDELLELLDEFDESNPERAARIRKLLYRAHEIATE